jgi:uncharacterized membrane protein
LAKVGTLVALVSILVAAEVRPYHHRSSTGLHVVSQCATLALFFYATVNDSGLTVGLEDYFGWVLFGLVILIVLCVFVFAWREQRARALAKKKNVSCAVHH